MININKDNKIILCLVCVKGGSPVYLGIRKNVFFFEITNFFVTEYFPLKIVLLERYVRVLFKNEVFLWNVDFKITIPMRGTKSSKIGNLH